MRVRVALCVGINDYPGSASDLSGCVNDAVDFQTALLSRGYDVQTLIDADATKSNIREALLAKLALLKHGDRFVFTFSGHGTWVPDKDGDEADQRDEALCCFDYSNGGLLLDDELHTIFQTRKGGRVTVVSDSCHSGTVARLVNPEPNRRKTDNKDIPKFVPPPLISDISVEEAVRMEAYLPVQRPRSTTVLMSGCADHEYSYDANFNGRPNGAFTYHLLKALEQGRTISEVHELVRASLPSPQYPQTPQLDARVFQSRTALF